ncbi:MAG TPA: DoxX family protein [Solirubrobacteraceae bacterium]|jgi:putative oxidoreductase|nr:DoxX family protein [Solirubrobacteraceae bacterium]
MKIGRLLLRVSVGGFFFGHGTQKLFGWFGGHGLDATAQAFDGMGLRPGKANAIAAGAAEAGGGALLASGVATPVAASVLTATMITAIKTVHGSKGPWLTNGGYEYNVVLIAAVLALSESGRERPGRAAAAALVIGALGSLGAHLAAAAAPAASVEAAEPAQAASEANGQPEANG